MAIQYTLTPSRTIDRAARLVKCRADYAWSMLQRQYQCKREDDLRVFYPHKTRYSHPFLAERMYGLNAPVEWCNEKSSKLRHVLQFDEKVNLDNKSVVIEPNDSGWTLFSTFGWKASDGKPSKSIVEKTTEYLLSKRVIGILAAKDGVREQIEVLFGRSVSNKVLDYKMMRALPVKPWIINKRLQNIECGYRDIRFLYVCSHYRFKCGDEVVNAWKKKQCKKGRLTIVVAPTDFRSAYAACEGSEDIQIVAEAPIRRAYLRRLLKEHDVSVCTTYTDGGANAFEAIEMGHALITSKYHRSGYLTSNRNGIVVDTPIKYYQNDGFALRWYDLDSFLRELSSVPKIAFERYEDELAKSFDFFLEDCSRVKEYGWRSWELACQESLYAGNLDLARYYSEAHR